MMTMLVATLGLLPAALSHNIGSDSQRPFAIVIVGGLISALLLSIFVLPTFYVWIARDEDDLPVAEAIREVSLKTTRCFDARRISASSAPSLRASAWEAQLYSRKHRHPCLQPLRRLRQLHPHRLASPGTR